MGGQDISFYAGDSRQLVVTVSDPAGTVENLTGAFLRYVLIQGQSIVLTKTTLNGGIAITAAANGQFTVYLAAADTAGLLGAYQHEIRMIDTAGNSSIILTGTVTVAQSFA